MTRIQKWERCVPLLLGIAAMTAAATPAGAYTLVGDTANPAQLLTAIRNAYNAGSNGVTIRPGKYAIPINPSGTAWDLSGMSNFTIDAPGVTLFFADSAYNLVWLSNNNNFTILGATFSSPPNFTQGRVYNAGSDAGGNYMDVQLDAGYPTDFTNTAHWTANEPFNVFDKTTRRWKTATADYGTTSLPITLDAANRKYRWHINTGDFLPFNTTIVNGDYIGIHGQSQQFMGIGTCSNVTFRNMTVNIGGENTWNASACGLITFDHCSYVYQPAPPGASAIGLYGPNGIQAGWNRQGLVMTNCLWQGSPDDVVNADAFTAPVGQASGSTLTYTGGGYVNNGDRLYFYDANGNVVGQRTVTSAPIHANFTPPDNTYGSVEWLNVTLDQPITLPYKYQMADINHADIGLTMKNCVIQNCRDVSLVISGVNADIENCLFETGTVSAISCENFSDNLTIKNNVFTYNGFTAANIWNRRNSAAIQIDRYGLSGRPNTNTTIQNNTFYNNYGVNISLMNSDGAWVTGNSFLNTHQDAPGVSIYTAGAGGYGQDAHSVIWLGHDNNTTLSGNTVAGQGANGSALIETDGACTNTKGLTSGVSYADTAVFEAENGVITNSVVSSNSAASNGQYVGGMVNANSSVKFTVNVPVAGYYPIFASYANASVDGAGNPQGATHNVVVNGGAAVPISYAYTGLWGVNAAAFTQDYVSGVVVRLNAGVNTIQFNLGNMFAELDKITILTPQQTDASSFFQLFNQNSGKVLAVQGASTSGGTPLQQYSDNGALDHHWKFQYVGNGYYKILNQNSGLELAANGAALVAPNGAQLIQNVSNGADDHLWKLVATGGGYFKIVNHRTGYVIEVTGGGTGDGALIYQNADSGGANQHWKLLDSRSGSNYRIGNSFTGKVLTPSGGQTADGTLLTQWDDNGAADHVWKLLDQGYGLYKFLNTNSGREMTIAGGSLNIADACISTVGNGADHFWRLLDSSGSFTLLNLNSGLVMGVNGMSAANGAEIFQTPENFSADHLWQLH
ncbi:hypothetical protein CCAX7_47340 [Capsulimonas corticalis]|uniref:Uncharacterized protein n=1 Tax=Capsulimonas corticalis TaxID=2219043 RepID=A0A402CQ99_9BACT|nr:RICIN domain-containing protein [Capsulimonas corticalis]BDI32683.1 hypothetical protein CCAX7_47340 [Capsulimonas corticalis]